MRCFPDTPFFMTDTKIKVHISFESSEKRNLCLHGFQQNFMLPARSVTLANFCLHAGLDECNHMGLSDKPALKSKVQ